jgi:predicted alpha/beta-hydrolase family hydrolase
MTTPEERIRIVAPRGEVSGAFAGPSKATAALVIAHGAGGNMDSAFLTGFARAMNGAGIATLRFNFLYTERGRRSPDPERTLREVWIAAFEAAAGRTGGVPVFAGGKSLGGRIASMCVADGELDAAGLVFLGYPLHPPGKPERVRDEHLYGIEVPMLFLQGTADPFARGEVLEPVLRRLGGRAEHAPVDGGDHSFRVKGVKRDDREIGASLAQIAAEFIVATVRG